MKMINYKNNDKTLIIENVSKKYRRRIVLNNLSLTFYSGMCYMLIGENGSGKSTLIKLILRLIYPTSGKIINSFNSISYVPEKINMPMNVSVIDLLKTISDLKGVKENIIDELLKYWCILEAKKYKLKQLSKGMLQKVLIIQAMMSDSEIYIFDEVLNGLDANMQQKFLVYVKELKKRGKLIIITSHYAKYYEEIVDRIIKLPSGEYVF